jgi:hypothetical protein
MDRYLFLDFDGVLHTNEPPRDLRFAKHLVPVATELELKVVISSTWREVYSVQAMAKQLGDLGKFVIGKTPVWNPPDGDLPDVGVRHREIEAWLEKNARLSTHWVALDDDADNYRRGCKQVFITDKKIGLDPKTAALFEDWCRKQLL